MMTKVNEEMLDKVVGGTDREFWYDCCCTCQLFHEDITNANGEYDPELVKKAYRKRGVEAKIYVDDVTPNTYVVKGQTLTQSELFDYFGIRYNV